VDGSKYRRDGAGGFKGTNDEYSGVLKYAILHRRALKDYPGDDF